MARLLRPDYNAFDNAYDRGFKQVDDMYRNAEARRDKMAVRNAYASARTDPLGAEDQLVAMGQFQGAESLRQRRTAGEGQQDQAYLQEMLGAGKLAEAHQWALQRGDAGLIKTVDQVVENGRKVASTIASVASSLQDIPDVNERWARFQTFKPQLEAIGIPTAEIDQNDVTDDGIRMLTGSVLDLEKTLGTVQTQKRGDNIDTVRITPFGSRTLSSTPVPQTRAEALQREEFDETRGQNAFARDMRDREHGLNRDQFVETRRRNRVGETHDERRIRLAEEEAAWEQKYGGGRSVNTMEGIRAKIARGEQLTAGETQLYQDGQRQPDPLASLYGPDDEMGDAPPSRAPARPTGPPARRPAGPTTRPSSARPAAGRGAPARVQSKAELDRLPRGALYINPADGRTLRKNY